MTLFKGVAPALASALTQRGFTALTPVQAAILEPDPDSDLLVSAQTGSGKTVAFGLAIEPNLLSNAPRFDDAREPLSLIIAPTRELALQVRSELDWLYTPTGARLVSCVGGMDMRQERRALSAGCHIVVGTPGRLRDHIERGALDLSWLRAVVLDEADEMLDLGFRDDLEFILDAAPADRRTLLFSATVAPGIASLAKRFQRNATRISTSLESEQHLDIDYQALQVAPNDRENAIINVLRFHESRSSLIFCATRNAVRHLSSRLGNRGFSAVALSGEMDQDQRNHALQAMRDGRARVCVATDVAARGIDLPNLDLVVHADLPNSREALLHRSGRTGRAGRKGVCALIVPYTKRKTAQRLLSLANITAEWSTPPSAEQISKRDRERLLEHQLLKDAPESDEEPLIAELLEQFEPRQLAAAVWRQYIGGKPAPEELLDNVPAADKKRERREPFEGGVWFRLSAGRKHGAEPRWLLPLICRAGHITRREVGAIQIDETETRFEIAAHVADQFAARTKDGTSGEKSIVITPNTSAPQDRDRGEKRHTRKTRPTSRKPSAAPHKKKFAGKPKKSKPAKKRKPRDS